MRVFYCYFRHSFRGRVFLLWTTPLSTVMTIHIYVNVLWSRSYWISLHDPMRREERRNSTVHRMRYRGMILGILRQLDLFRNLLNRNVRSSVETNRNGNFYISVILTPICPVEDRNKKSPLFLFIESFYEN